MGATNYYEEVKARDHKEALRYLKARTSSNSPYNQNYYRGPFNFEKGGEVLLTDKNREDILNQAYDFQYEKIDEMRRYDMGSVKVGIEYYSQTKITVKKVPEGYKQISVWIVKTFDGNITYHDTKALATKAAINSTKRDGKKALIEKGSVYVDKYGRKTDFKLETVIEEKKLKKPAKDAVPIYRFIFFGLLNEDHQTER